MGNEMGNNNTSELREEEDNKISETEGKAALEPIYSNGLKEENNVVPTPENIDYSGKDCDDDSKAAVHSNGKEPEESELKLIEENGTDTEFQMTEELEDCNGQNSLNYKANVSAMSIYEIENESPLKNEVEDIALTKDIDCEDSAEHESKQEEIRSLINVSEPNIDFGVKEKSHELGNPISNHVEASVVPELSFQEDLRLTDDRLEVGKEDCIVEAQILEENDGVMLTRNGMDADEEIELIVKESHKGDSEKRDDQMDDDKDSAANSLLTPNDEKDDPAADDTAKDMDSVCEEETFENGIHSEPASSEGRIGLDPETLCTSSELPIEKHDEAEAVQISVPEFQSFTPIINGIYSEDKEEQTLEKEAKTEAPELAQAYNPSSPASLLQLEDQQQKTAMKCEDPHDSSSQVKPKSSRELAAPFYTTTTEIPNILTQNHSTKACNGPIPESLIGEHKETVADDKFSGESDKQTINIKALIPSGINNEELESTERFSVESIPDSYAARAEMRKSPSFGIDLRIEAARTKESDQTPLLYQKNTTNDHEDVSHQSALLPVEYNRESLKYQPLPQEEKVMITLEKSDSNKSKSPFIVEPRKQDKQDPDKNDKSPSASKSKDKHRRRSSLFTNCMCCTTVLN